MPVILDDPGVPAAGRFAPSPSADLHLGNLRTALLAWLGARHQGAAFHLRIDDLDAGRSRPATAERQLSDLACLGLDHDGAVLRQSERLTRYRDAFASLAEAGHVYPCFCTRAELRDAQRAPHGQPTAHYPGTCRTLPPAVRAAHEAAGRRPAWRLRATGAAEHIDDLVLGPQTVVSDDAVLMRADGEYGYQLAVVLDDADQSVGEVVRGADLLPSVGTQRALQRLLGLAPQQYAHVPLMLGPDGARLAKRHGAATLSDALHGTSGLLLPGLRAGHPATPDAVRGALAATAGLASPGESPSLPELLERFSYQRLPTQSTMMQGC
jgi:glutamyl-tRNA synthetase